MNRLALFCTVLLLALTAVAFVHDRNAETAPVLLEAAPTPLPAFAAAAAPAAAPSAPPEPLLDAEALDARIDAEVLAPLRGPQGVAIMSRVARPVRPKIQFRWLDRPAAQTTEPRFQLYEHGNPFSRDLRERRLATGRIDRRTGRITLSVGATETFVDLASGLERLGAKR